MDYAFCSTDITELSKAMIEVQKNLLPAFRDAVNPYVHNRYATLNSVMDACRNALLEQGILLTQYPVPVDGDCLGLVTKFVHAETGQYQASLAVIPLAKRDPQAMGSAFTYGRRYALSAMLGIVPEVDDDANAACGYSQAANRQKQVRTPAEQKQVSTAAKSPSTRRTPLSTMLADLGLSELKPQYGAYLRNQYACSPDKLNAAQYQEQKAILERCKTEPLAKRDLIRTLHEYR
ncbi:MAG: ERF family protein [Desulfovibrio sp.]|nr:ERF family protein [Desulfovibrio sp.]